MRKFEKELEVFVSNRLNLSKKEADSFVNDFERHMKNCVETGAKIVWTNFFTMEQYTTKARTGRNPKTGEPIEIPAKLSVKTKVSPAWKRDMNKGRITVVTKGFNVSCLKNNSMDGELAAELQEGQRAVWTDSNGMEVGTGAEVKGLSVGTYFLRITDGAGNEGVQTVVIEDDGDCEAV